jgi:hypothetical protein
VDGEERGQGGEEGSFKRIAREQGGGGQGEKRRNAQTLRSFATNKKAWMLFALNVPKQFF